MAWLHARPKPKKRLAAAERAQSRFERMKEDGIEPRLPPCPGPWIVEWLFELGPTVSTGMGSAPIGWADVEAWKRATLTELKPWEARMLRRLSIEYVGWMHRAEDPECPAPWTPEAAGMAANREAVSRKVGQAFRALALAQRSSAPRGPKKVRK